MSLRSAGSRTASLISLSLKGNASGCLAADAGHATCPGETGVQENAALPRCSDYSLRLPHHNGPIWT